MGKPTNISTAVNKSKTPSTNRSSSQNIYDRMRSYFASIDKKNSEIGTNGKFYGFVLYSNPLTVDQFKEIFRNNKEFLDDVIIEGSNSISTKSSAEVVEMYVYVPQLTDFLPEPDIGLLNNFIKLRKDKNVIELLEKQRAEFEALANAEFEPSQSRPAQPDIGPPSFPSPVSAEARKVKRASESRRLYRKLRDTLDVITMYPKVYKYTENKDYYAPGTACEIRFPNDVQKSMLTMGYGIFKKELTGTIVFGDSDSGALDQFSEDQVTS